MHGFLPKNLREQTESGRFSSLGGPKEQDSQGKMVAYTLWGRDVDLDIPKEVFPTESELKEMEDALPGCEHGWFQSTRTKKWLHYRKFLPPSSDGTPPKAVVVWQHGIHAHSGTGYKLSNGRMTNMSLLSSEMTKSGYALYALDMFGHGFSEGTRFYVPDWTVNRDDLDAFARSVASEYSSNDVPLFLMGDSYGGTLAIHVTRKWQDERTVAAARTDGDSSSTSPATVLSSPPKSFHGVLLTAPAIIGDLPPAVVVFILRYMIKPLFPKWVPFFMPNTITPERIWRDPEARKCHSEPRCKEMRLDGSGMPFRLGTADSLLSALECVRTDSIPGLTIPFCVAHGACDVAVPCSGSEYLLEHAKTAPDDRVVNEIDGGFHDLLSEPNAEEIMQFLLDWIKERIERGPAL